MAIVWQQRFILRVVLGLVAIGVVGGGVLVWKLSAGAHAPRANAHGAVVAQETHDADTPEANSEGDGTIEFPQASWKAAGIQFEPVKRQPLDETITLTGKISLNEDRVAHIYPLVSGRVEEVNVQLGDPVQPGDLLVVVQSTEVGHAMLQLFQHRLERSFALTKNEWTQTVAENTRAMIELIGKNASIDDIEKQLIDRPMGEYRDTLMTAYIDYYKARQHWDRLLPLSKEGAITGKQLLEAEANWNAARATLQSLVEQLEQDARQASIISAQSVKELDTRVAVDEANLRMLGFEANELADIDPVRQGEALAHYPIRSPFAGTIISKDVVLMERVGPETQILSIADLSTVWVAADIYEEHIPLLVKLKDQKVQLRSNSWPNRTFEARIFYTGDLVNESTRTVSMRAVADNREGLLKPGMFVNVILPRPDSSSVVQVPLSAVQEHAGATFVFVHLEGDQFARRDVVLGRRNDSVVEIVQGLEGSEQVVVQGGFALKSRMLVELLGE